MPGRVDLWPIVEKEETPDPAAWYDPVDMPAPGNPAERLADGIAAELHRLIHVEGETIPAQDGTRRPMTEGDVLILVQGRSGANDLFPAIIRALKERELKVAGADRLKIASELAVRDLQALLKFLALPEDDLSLAAALRSPIFGWSEDDLYRLAAGREKKPYLWQVLRDAPERDQINTMLGDLRKWADFLRPYDLLERILVRHGARTRLVARLGTEAEDGIDELLNQALAYERQEIPSLTGFLGWLEGEATEVKRQADSAAGMIQVMTVHGAKGLERPVVILPDTLRLERNARDTVLLDPVGRAHWRTSKDEAPERIAAELEASARRERMERQRLLYVAMTRAESWLMVAGAGQEPKEAATWYGHVRDALQRCKAVETEMPTGTGLRFETGDWGAGDLKAKEPPARPAVDLPGLGEPACLNARPRRRDPGTVGSWRCQGASRRTRGQTGRTGPGRAASARTAGTSAPRTSPRRRPRGAAPTLPQRFLPLERTLPGNPKRGNSPQRLAASSMTPNYPTYSDRTRWPKSISPPLCRNSEGHASTGPSTVWSSVPTASLPWISRRTALFPPDRTTSPKACSARWAPISRHSGRSTPAAGWMWRFSGPQPERSCRCRTTS